MPMTKETNPTRFASDTTNLTKNPSSLESTSTPKHLKNTASFFSCWLDKAPLIIEDYIKPAIKASA